LIAAGTSFSTAGSAAVGVDGVVEDVDAVELLVPVPDGGVTPAFVLTPPVLLLLLLPHPAIATMQTSGIKLFQLRMRNSSWTVRDRGA
jgi:hypothetical protein